MYANKYADGPRFRPASLGAALAINAAFVTALLLANPDIIPKVAPERTQTFDVPLAKPSPEPTQEIVRERPRPQPTTAVVTPERQIVTPIPSENTVTGDAVIRDPVAPFPGTGTGTGTGPATFPVDPPIPPAFVAARQDPRYLADFQPAYPDYERDAGREGVVKLRVRIGTDGRVKQVERIDGRDSFVRASIAHALAKWRFTPATRGGVPEESWKVMTVRFTLDN